LGDSKARNERCLKNRMREIDEIIKEINYVFALEFEYIGNNFLSLLWMVLKSKGLPNEIMKGVLCFT
jgi:hypothetical protein